MNGGDNRIPAKEATGLEVAVIGMAGRFPGAGNIHEFWENLENGIESITFFADEELKVPGFDSTFLENSNFVKARGYLEGTEYFDAAFWGYSPAEAGIMDPQLRFLYECAWEGLEDAGCEPDAYEGLIGVYFGASDNFYWKSLVSSALEKAGAGLENISGLFADLLLVNKDFISSRLSYQLNLTGPSTTIYSGCSTSLVTIHRACRELLGGECDMALAGGVSIVVPQKKGFFYQEGMIESRDGHCRAFDVRGSGTVFGSGAGVVVLKRLQDALDDGNHIYAVIKGSAVNNDGRRKVGFTAPSVEGLSDVIRAALQVAEVDPGSIGYIEAHGTGTRMGDPIEMKALVRGMNRGSTPRCAVGAVKTNIGHLDAAAGSAGFIKAVLCLMHRRIPPTLHFESANPELELENSPFYISNRLIPWERQGGQPLRAAVTAFAIGGTNAHVILEEWPWGVSRREEGGGGTQGPQLILLSAKTENALDKMTENLVEYFKKNPDINFADVAYTLQVGRKAFVHRRILVCSTAAEAIEALSTPGSPAVQTMVANVSPDIRHQSPVPPAQAQTGEPERRGMLQHLGLLWLSRQEIDWKSLHSGSKRYLVSLPPYPFERKRYWIADNLLITQPRDVPAGTLKTTQRHPRPHLDTPYAAPENEIQQKLAHIWQRFFGLEQVGIDDDFFKLGGDSLKAMTVVFDIQREFYVNVTLAEFFKRCTVRGLAEYVGESVGAKRGYTPIPLAEEKEYYPLSPAQNRLFILHQMEPGNIIYNETSVFEPGIKPDIQSLEDTFKKIISRHESLRTSFLMIGDEPVQRVHSQVEFKIEYYSAISAFVRPFDLAVPPLVRAGLIHTPPSGHPSQEGIPGDKYILVVDKHHIVVDGRSQDIFVRDFIELASGRQPAPLHIQYKDFVQWLNGNEMKKSIKAQETYWLKEFAGDIPCLELPLDYNRPQVQSFEGSLMHFVVDKSESQALKRLASAEKVTMFMLVLALFNVLLSRLSGQEDIVVGTLIAGREHADLQSLVGMFANTLAFRNFPNPHLTFTDFLKHLKKRTLEAFENQDYPYEELVQRVAVARDTGRNPLFDVVFILQAAQSTASPQVARTVQMGEEVYDNGIARFDMVLTALDTTEGTAFKWQYCTRLFKRETLQRFIGYFKKLISSLIEDPNQKISAAEMITEEEKRQILFDFNDTAENYPRDKTVHQLFNEQAEKTPDHIAAVAAHELHEISITYRELNKKSGQLAGVLREKGVLADDIIAIKMDRSVELVIGILGILAAGGAYLPIDREYPQERIDYMLKDSKANLLLTNLPEGHHFHHSSNQFINHHSGLLAYVIYTSGSTGSPKGVLVEQCNVVRLIKNTNYIEFRETDRILQTGALAFDASTFEIWGALLNGLTLFLRPGEEILDPGTLKQNIRRYDISTLWLTSALFDRLCGEDVEIFAGLKNLLVGGDVLSPVHIQRVRERFPGLNVVNGYGPTENTTFSTTYLIDRYFTERIPIGKPIANSTVYITDRWNNLVPVGVVGELWVGGDGVSRGYLNNPELTAERFLKVFYRSNRSYRTYIPSKVIYRTGDLARWLPDGNIEFLGRMDRQVKIRGFRIELGEIESRLLKKPGIKETVVIDREAADGEKYLCAYIVLTNDGEFEKIPGIESELKTHLSRSLPDYMVPAYFVKVDHIPVTPGGKIDRKALPAPGIAAGRSYVPPGDEIEEQLLNIWLDVLGFGEKSNISIGIDDNFFDLGGHSLKATILSARIHKTFDIKIPLVEIFKTPFIRALAAYIKEAEKDIYEAVRSTEKKEFYPQSSAQKRLFFLDRFKQIGTSYNIPEILEVNEKPDKEKYRRVFERLIARHETLRTSFHLIDNEPVQKVHEPEEVIFEIEGGNRPLDSSSSVEGIIRNFVRPFDLSTPPLLRLGIVEIYAGPPGQPGTADKKYLLLFDIHHIVGDGTSMVILTDEFIRLYKGRSLPPLRIQYRDFTLWQNNLFKSGKIEQQEAYWVSRYPDPAKISRLNFPTDYPRPEILSFEGDNYSFGLGPDETAALKKLLNMYEVTLYILLMSIFNILLHKYSGQEEIIVNGGIAGRPHEDLQHLIGMFVNMLPIRNQPQAHKTYREFLIEVKKNCIDAFENQDMQFEELVDRLNLERDPSRSPFSDVSMVVQNFEPAKGKDGEFALTNYETQSVSKTAKFDLTLYAYDLDYTLYFNLEYSTSLFRPETIKKIAAHVIEIIKQVAADQDIRLEDITISYELKDARTNIFKGAETEFEF